MMIRQDQIASSYPIHLPFTRTALLTERAILVAGGTDPDRVAEIDDILADVEAGRAVLSGP